MVWKKIKVRVLEESWRLWTPLAKLSFLFNDVTYGRGLKVYGLVKIYNKEGKIVLGDNVVINSARWANPVGFSTRTTIRIIGRAKLVIGDYVGISNTNFSCAGNIEIKNNTIIGCGCTIMDTDFHEIISSNRMEHTDQIPVAPILIEDNCFLGAGVTVLKGVTIKSGSVIGACSVVTKSTDEKQVWAGNPARFIKSL